MGLLVTGARVVVTMMLAGVLLSAPAAPAAPAAAPAASPGASAEAASPRAAACRAPGKGFRPTRARLSSVKRALRVVKVRRTKSGAVGTPPTTRAGKWMVGWDPWNRPGRGRGSVIMVAHTWPDGSALGNAMLRSTKRGDRLVIRGAKGQRACYRVTKRASYPANKVPRRKAFRPGGPEQLVIVVCSGKRLGPGRWTRRTIFYARPDRG